VNTKWQDKTDAIELGLAILQCHAKEGRMFTLQDIASWCDCHAQAIRRIELIALRKVRNRVRFGKLHQLHQELC